MVRRGSGAVIIDPSYRLRCDKECAEVARLLIAFDGTAQSFGSPKKCRSPRPLAPKSCWATGSDNTSLSPRRRYVKPTTCNRQRRRLLTPTESPSSVNAERERERLRSTNQPGLTRCGPPGIEREGCQNLGSSFKSRVVRKNPAIGSPSLQVDRINAPHRGNRPRQVAGLHSARQQRDTADV
jgi:hypothetical protein